MTKFKIATLFGIPIYLDLTLGFLMAYVLLFLGGPFEYRLIMALMLPLSILLHELAHSLTGMLFGGRILAIQLYLLGGAALMSSLPRKAWQEGLVAVAGPLMSLFLGGLFWGGICLLEIINPLATPGIRLLAMVLYASMYLNFGLAVFNLFPAFPLDGGRILRAILQGFKCSRFKATDIAVTVGRGFAVFWITLWIATTCFGMRFDIEAWNCPEWLNFILAYLLNSDGLLLPLIAYMIWVSGMQELRYVELEAHYNGDDR